MRKVICRITGECGYNYEFYKAPNGKYYKSKELYDNTMAQREFRTKILYLINSDILNKNASNCASLIGKLINETGLEANVIYESILQNMDYIKKLIKESNESDSTKIHSIFSIATKRLNKVTYAGCYEIRNNKTNEVYIGESINLFGRFTEHISKLYENKHHCEKLQEAFNETKSISDFTITPLFMFPISSIDKNKVKQETLYLESAFYIIAKSNHEELYNTRNPYLALKDNSVSLDMYEIDCKKILHLLANDKYGVLPIKLLNTIRNNLQEDGLLITEDIAETNVEISNTTASIKSDNESSISYREITVDDYKAIDLTDIAGCIAHTKNLLKDNVKLYRITNLLKELASEGFLPIDYDYSKIREILTEKNFITVDSLRNTIATDYALKNGFYFISGITNRNGESVYSYYVSEKFRGLLIDIFSHYKNIDDLKRVS